MNVNNDNVNNLVYESDNHLRLKQVMDNEILSNYSENAKAAVDPDNTDMIDEVQNLEQDKITRNLTLSDKKTFEIPIEAVVNDSFGDQIDRDVKDACNSKYQVDSSVEDTDPDVKDQNEQMDHSESN